MKNFNEIYGKINQECQQPMEEMRKKARNGMIIVGIAFTILGLILTILTGQGIFMSVAIIGIALYIVLSKNNKEYKKFFKEKVVKRFVKEYSETLDYIPERGIVDPVYREGEFEACYDRYTTEDLITGTLDGKYKINMAEVHTEDESTDSDGDRTYTTIFHGLFAKIEFEKNVDTNMKIRKNAITIMNKKDKIEMDSGEFEKKFNVFASNKIIAMQLLTADIMQMILDFNEKNKIRPEMTLKGNTLYIRFATGSMFEPKFLKRSLDYDTLKKYYDTINFTLDITEKFLKNMDETEL